MIRPLSPLFAALAATLAAGSASAQSLSEHQSSSLPASSRPEARTQPRPDAQPESDDTPGGGFFSGVYRRAQRPAWNFEFEANAWYASPGGEIALGNAPPVKASLLNVDSPRAVPMVEAHARFDPFTLSLRGSLLDATGTSTLAAPATFGTVTYATAERVSTNYRLDEAELRLGYRVYQFDADPNRRDRPLLSAGVTLVGGARLYDGSVGVSGPSGQAGSSFTQLEPLIGFSADVSFADRYEIQFQNTHAYAPEIDGQSSFSVDIQVSFKYRPADNAAIQLGYRLRRNVLEGDGYELDGAVAGLFAGLTLRF